MATTTETPRVLDVTKFLDVRGTELRYLLQAVRHQVGGNRLGIPLLPRHLRRRATSHRRFIVRFRPNLRLARVYGRGQTQSQAAGVAAGGASSSNAAAGTGDGGAAASAPAPGPSLRRGGSCGGGAGGRFKRARLAEAGPDDRDEDATGAHAPPTLPPQRPTNRAMRRRPARLQAAVESSAATDMAPTVAPSSASSGRQPNPLEPTGAVRTTTPRAGDDAGSQGGREVGAFAVEGEERQQGQEGQQGQQRRQVGVSEGPGLRRLETHVWHSRRMAMETRWGHALPAHAPGRSRGSRSLFAQLRRGALLHDSSYLGCAELRGHQRDLAGLLRRVSDPALVDAQLATSEVVSGAVEWALPLHRPDAFPRHCLAPARAIWLSQPRFPSTGAPHTLANGSASAAGTRRDAGGDVSMGAADKSGDDTIPTASTGDDNDADVDADGWARRCSLWLWVHAAAFADVWQALHDAAASADAREAKEAEAAASGGRVVIVSRCPDLRRIEVVGPRAEAALAQVLQPLSEQQEQPKEGAGPAEGVEVSLGGSIWRSIADLGSGEGAGGGRGRQGWRWRWPASAAVGFVSADPRLAPAVKVGAAEADALAEAAAAAASPGAEEGERLTQPRAQTQGHPQESQQRGQAQQWRGQRWRCVELLSAETLRPQLRQWPEGGDWTAGASALWHCCGPSPPPPQPASTMPDAPTAPAPPPASAQVPSAPLAPAARGHEATITTTTTTTTTAAAAAPNWAARRVPPVPPPLTEAGVATVRQAARQRLLRAGLDPTSGPGADYLLPSEPSGTAAGAREPTGNASSASNARLGVAFPVLLVRRDGSWMGSLRSANGSAAGAAAAAAAGDAAAGWSVVVPARWVMPLWTALAYTGARPVGQSEWRQLATHFHTPCFPYDHPYTPAGARHAAQVISEQREAALRRPSGRSPPPADAGPLAEWTRLMSPLPDPRDCLRDLLGITLPGKPRAPRRAPANSKDKAVVASNAAPIAAAPTAVAAADVAASGAVASGAGSGAAAATEGLPLPPPPSLSKCELPVVLHAGVLRALLLPPGGQSSWQQQQQQQQPTPRQGRSGKGGGTSAASAAPRVDKSCLHGWTLRKALRLGLVAPPAPPQPPLPPLPAPVATDGDILGPVNSGGSGARSSGCLVYVALQVEGRGVCEAGAEVVACWGPSGERPGNGRADPSGASAAPTAAATSTAAFGTGRASSSFSSGAAVVLGFVVSAATRGSPAYPGGLALCDAGGVARLIFRQHLQQPRHRQHQQQPRSSGLRPQSSAVTQDEREVEEAVRWWFLDDEGPSGRSGSRQGPSALKLWVRNPGSDTLRECRGLVLLAGEGAGAGVAGRRGRMAGAAGLQLAW